jgi:hypothetical protein
MGLVTSNKREPLIFYLIYSPIFLLGLKYHEQEIIHQAGTP